MIAPLLVEVVTSDDPANWAAAGFEVIDARIRLGSVAIVCDPTRPTSTPALCFDAVNPSGADSLDGIEWQMIEWQVGDGGPDGDLRRPAPVHPNGVGELDHLVIMAPDLDRVRAAVLDAGLEIRRERPTMMGTTAITQLFAWSGPALLEIVAPTAAAEPPPNVADRPAELWGVALVAPDLDATVAWFGDGCSSAKNAVQPGRRIATVRHRALGLGLTVAVMTPHRRTD